MFPNPFFAAMGGAFGGMNNMGAMAGQGMPGQGMTGQGMAGFMGGQGMAGPGMSGGPAGPAGPMVSMQGAQDGPGPSGGAGASGGGGGGGGGGGNRQQVDRNRVCLKFMQTGSCNYGDNCKYAHLTRAEANLVGGPQGGQQGGDRGGGRRGNRGGGGDDDGGGRAKNMGARKTRLCEKFMTLGHCPYGDKCTFAHGPEELRSVGPRDGVMVPEGPAQPSIPGPAPPPEPYPVAAAAGAAGARPSAATASPPAPKPQGGAHSPGPQAPAAAKQPQSQSQSQQQEVTFVDKVRALCGVLAIGNAAALAAGKPLALQTAAMSLRNGNALRENPFADSVERYLQAAQQQA